MMDSRHSKASTRRRLAAALAGTAVIALAMTGCTGDGDSSRTNADGRIPMLNFGGFGGGSNPKENYNPYLATALGVGAYLYEPLMMLNEYSCEYEPWLATGMEWTDPSTLVHTLRDGVKFSDGTPLTADDVVFTYEMLKKYPALDARGAWTALDSVAAVDDHTVTFTFDGPGASSLLAVNSVLIVPKHLWSSVSDPTTFTNTEPVGTGPMVIDTFTPTTLTLERNPGYWQADEIQVEKIRFNNSDQGQVDQLKLARGDFDQNAMYIPDIEKSYVAKNPEHNKYWFPSGSPISLYMNLEKAPFDDQAFREAIAQAIDKKSIVDDAQQGYVAAASQTSLVLPNAEDWLPSSIPDDGYISYDVAAAKATLDEAGYALDASGARLGTDGKPLNLSIQIPGGWNDWIQAAKIVQKNFQALGITVDMQNPTPEVQGQNRLTGQYDLTFGVRGGSCDMYRNFMEPLASSETAPTGEVARTNEIRWRDAETDRLIEQLRQQSDPAEQKETVGQLATIVYEQKPFIPLWYGASWFEYTTSRAVGWPSADDPYAKPSNMPIILTHLRPAE